MFRVWNNIHKKFHLQKLQSYSQPELKPLSYIPYTRSASDQLQVQKQSWDLCKPFDSNLIWKDTVYTSTQISAFLFTACEHCSFCTFSYSGLAHRCWHCCSTLPEEHVHQTSSHWGVRALHEHSNKLFYNSMEDSGMVMVVCEQIRYQIHSYRNTYIIYYIRIFSDYFHRHNWCCSCTWWRDLSALERML